MNRLLSSQRRPLLISLHSRLLDPRRPPREERHLRRALAVADGGVTAATRVAIRHAGVNF